MFQASATCMPCAPYTSLRARGKQRGIPGKPSAKPRAHPELSLHELVIIINYLTMMFI
jgi:hypothetical protein